MTWQLRAFTEHTLIILIHIFGLVLDWVFIFIIIIIIITTVM